jgi:putative NIF3 family GTP cyclohydrolase 1 type 2
MFDPPRRSLLVMHLVPLLNSTRTRSELPLIYHEPCTHEDPPVTTALLSLDPTPDFYADLSSHSPPPDLVFLHHPWNLDRRRVPKNTLVIASHEGFDDTLTTGWNPRLAGRLGVARTGASVESVGAQCLRGYKGDDARPVGLVGRMAEPEPCVENFVDKVLREFGGAETALLFGNWGEKVKTLACLNAFNREVVQMVVDEAKDGGTVIVTGEYREAGMAAAKELGILAAVCVGHRRGEMWGIRWLQGEIQRWSGDATKVVVVDEEEKAGGSVDML